MIFDLTSTLGNQRKALYPHSGKEKLRAKYAETFEFISQKRNNKNIYAEEKNEV